MIKKLVILGLIIVGAYFFYKHFMASSLEPFFKQKVDVFGLKAPKVKQ